MLKKNQPTGNPYIRLGKMPAAAARALKIKPYEIYVSDNNLRHIQKAHGVELSKLGVTPLAFVKMIVGSYNQIRKGTGDSYWLIIYSEDYPAAAAIQVNYSLKRGFIEIKTAAPMRTTEIDKKTLLWSK